MLPVIFNRSSNGSSNLDKLEAALYDKIDRYYQHIWSLVDSRVKRRRVMSTIGILYSSINMVHDICNGIAPQKITNKGPHTKARKYLVRLNNILTRMATKHIDMEVVFNRWSSMLKGHIEKYHSIIQSTDELNMANFTPVNRMAGFSSRCSELDDIFESSGPSFEGIKSMQKQLQRSCRHSIDFSKISG